MRFTIPFLKSGFRVQALIFLWLAFGCQPREGAVSENRIRRMTDQQAAQQAKSIESSISPTLSKGLTLKIWAVDSLVTSPVSIDIDDEGTLYYTHTNRQKNSEFDIRGHQDWEIESIRLQSIDDK